MTTNMHSAFIKLICSTTGTQSQQMRLGICQMLEDWAHKQGYEFRNLYPGKHQPYSNRLSPKVGPHPDSFDYPVTYLLMEGTGAYDHLINEPTLLSANLVGFPSALFRVDIMRWIIEDQELALAPESVEISQFRMPWEPVYMSRSKMAILLRYWPEKAVAVECSESRFKSQNLDTAKHMLRSVLFDRNAFLFF